MRATVALAAAGMVSRARRAPGASPEAPVDLIPAREVRRLQQRGEAVTLVDVRTRPEYLARHITGAVCVPVQEIEQRAREIPRIGLVVVY